MLLLLLLLSCLRELNLTHVRYPDAHPCATLFSIHRQGSNERKAPPLSPLSGSSAPSFICSFFPPRPAARPRSLACCHTLSLSCLTFSMTNRGKSGFHFSLTRLALSRPGDCIKVRAKSFRANTRQRVQLHCITSRPAYVSSGKPSQVRWYARVTSSIWNRACLCAL